MSVAPIRQLKQKHGFQPFEQDFSYTGDVQNVTIPANGLYKLEVWGAQGGSSGANGGYSVGYIDLSKNDVLYIVVGGQGGGDNCDSFGWHYIGGYNGGGDIYTNSARNGQSCGGGGGATHIAKVTGKLADIGATSFVDNGNGLIVAGGGAGYYGGNGGGTNGGDGSSYADATRGTGGTQSSGGSNPYTWDGKTQGSFGRGGNGVTDGCYQSRISGGGGGLYGGGGGVDHAQGHTGSLGGGGGGSGYTGGVPQITYKGHTYSPSMTNGQQSGNGKAKITRIA